jgi:hypothetical protein
LRAVAVTTTAAQAHTPSNVTEPAIGLFKLENGRYVEPRFARRAVPCPVLTNTAEVIREKVQDGLTGETKEMQYTQCKIVGNGSFGVVFQTKLSPSGEDAAIKRVLQDKRFKVSTNGPRAATCRTC